MIRIFHWANMIAITMLTLTGFYIHAPQTFRLFSSMDTARTIHFAMAYLLLVGVVGRVYYAITANDAKNIVYRPIEDTKSCPACSSIICFWLMITLITGSITPGRKGCTPSGWLWPS